MRARQRRADIGRRATLPNPGVGARIGNSRRTRCPVSRWSRTLAIAVAPVSEPRGEATALVVGELQTPGTELFAQDAVLFHELVDDVALLLVEPPGECDQDELQGM